MAKPLVSVLLITYNSSKFIEETLESALNQTYQKIELIISDDGSTDDTVKICKKWLKNNNQRFVNSEIICVERNTGIPANCNRGLRCCEGEWIKLIAGDDILYPECITMNVDYICANKEAKVVQSLCNLYLKNFEGVPYDTQPSTKKYDFFNLSTGSELYDYILKVAYNVFAPAIFIEKKILEEIGGFDERFKLMEDYPLWLKLTKKNVKINLLTEITVGYRISDNSVMKDKKIYMTEKFAKESIFFLNNFFSPYDRDFRVKKEIFKFKIIILLDKYGFNKPNFFSKVIYSLIFKF